MSRQAIADEYLSLSQVEEALNNAGLESSNLIIGIDCTSSNTSQGLHSFGADFKHLHKLHNQVANPYERAMAAILRTLERFDDDGLIPVFGFGDGTRMAPCTSRPPTPALQLTPRTRRCFHSCEAVNPRRAWPMSWPPTAPSSHTSSWPARQALPPSSTRHATSSAKTTLPTTSWSSWVMGSSHAHHPRPTMPSVTRKKPLWMPSPWLGTTPAACCTDALLACTRCALLSRALCLIDCFTTRVQLAAPIATRPTAQSLPLVNRVCGHWGRPMGAHAVAGRPPCADG